LETSLFPVLFNMKCRGVRVNLEQADLLKQQLVKEELKIIKGIEKESGIEEVRIWAANSVAKVFDACKISYNHTAKGSPSFTKAFLANHGHPVAKMVMDARELNKAHSTFIDTIIKHEHKGRIHADIRQLKGEVGGTVTGRLSMSNPNLQQVPARNKKNRSHDPFPVSPRGRTAMVLCGF